MAVSDDSPDRAAGSAAIPAATATRGRWAVAAMFLVNGFVTGSWAPQIPALAERMRIGESALGLLILAFGAGAVAAMAGCGPLLARYGSRRVLRGFAAAIAFGLPAVAFAPGLAVAVPALCLFGAVVGGMDVAMNANAVAVERRLRRAVMSSLHGFWSVGGFIGAGAGGWLLQRHGHQSHALLVAAVAAAVLFPAMRRLLPDRDGGAPPRQRFALPRDPLVYLVGTIALFSMVPEGAVLDWAALYLQQERGAGAAAAAFGFAAFSGAMALMRFAGDAVRDRYGAVATLRASSLVAAAGMLVAGLSPSPGPAIAAFALCGLGIANMVPIAFSAAGNQPGLAPGAGLSVVTLMGYSGILIAPSGIGFVGERAGLGPVFATLSGLLVAVFLMAGLARSADFGGDRAPAR